MALRTDELQRGGFVLSQDTEGFCFGSDAVMLAAFAAVRPGQRVCDLGCGNGVLPVLLCARYKPGFVLGVEIQAEAAALARKNAEQNGLGEKIDILHADLRGVAADPSFDLVISNPPYLQGNSGKQNESEALRIARHEVCCTLADVVAAAARLLRPGGRFCIIHRPQRLCDLFCLMRAAGIEPKVLQLVQPSSGKAPCNILVEGKQGARPGLITRPPLVMYEAQGRYTTEMLRIYDADHERAGGA